jgi:hypothetical protein
VTADTVRTPGERVRLGLLLVVFVPLALVFVVPVALVGFPLYWAYGRRLERRRYWGGTKEFNPLALLFPKRGRARTIRFWRAFRDFKHGKERALRAAEAELFDFVETIRGGAA